MKKTLLLTLGLLLTMTTAKAGWTSDYTVLRIDSITFDGNGMEKMWQYIVVSGENTSDDDCQTGLYLLVEDAGGNIVDNLTVSLKANAHDSIKGRKRCTFPQGNYTVWLTADRKGQQRLASCPVSIGPVRPFQFDVQFNIDMMRQEDGQNVLYGDLLLGSAKITNMDNVPYYGVTEVHNIEDFPYLYPSYGFVSRIVDNDTEYEWPNMYDALAVLPCESFVFDFEKSLLVEGHSYTFHVYYVLPTGPVEIGSMDFVCRESRNTYWTADGQVKPLPMEDGHQLVVPEEAVVVDMRRQFQMAPILFTIDVGRANPNCLYYIDFADNVPKGMTAECNLVRNRNADVIRLTDGYDFFCPMRFNAKYISYTLKTEEPMDEEGAWSETLVLPFTTKGATLLGVNGSDVMLHGNLLKVYRYDGVLADTLTTAETSASGMEAYQPYIVKVDVPSSVCFYAEYTAVPVTKDAVNEGGHYDFVGATTFWAADENTFRYLPSQGCFAIVETEDMIPPFRACIVRDKGVEGEGAGMQDVTSLKVNFGTSETMPTDIAGAVRYVHAPQTVFTLSGQRMKSGSLPAGIYIVGGKKVLVR